MDFQPGALILLFFGHWVGDYLFQTSDMAIKKSASLKWLTVHVGVYTITVLAFSFVIFPQEVWWKFGLLNGALHWITDLFTSRLATRYATNLRVFYPILGFDQFIHVATLMATIQIVQ